MYTAKDIDKMAWPIDAIADLLMKSARAEEINRIETLREESLHMVLETELMETEEVYDGS